MITAKENVIRTLQHNNPEWVPVNLWQLPATRLKYGEALDDIINNCELDILSAPFNDPTEDERHYKVGSYTDCWGSVWENRQAGIIGEVKEYPFADFSKVWDYENPKKLFLSGVAGFEETKNSSKPTAINSF